MELGTSMSNYKSRVSNEENGITDVEEEGDFIEPEGSISTQSHSFNNPISINQLGGGGRSLGSTTTTMTSSPSTNINNHNFLDYFPQISECVRSEIHFSQKMSSVTKRKCGKGYYWPSPTPPHRSRYLNYGGGGSNGNENTYVLTLKMLSDDITNLKNHQEKLKSIQRKYRQ